MGSPYNENMRLFLQKVSNDDKLMENPTVSEIFDFNVYCLSGKQQTESFPLCSTAVGAIRLMNLLIIPPQEFDAFFNAILLNTGGDGESEK